MRVRSKQIALALGAGVVAVGGQAAAWGQSNPAPVKRHYHPHIDPADFGRKIDNRYLPFKPGTRTVAEGVAENGKTPQRDVQVVTHRKRTVDGVKCVVVRDTITSRGNPVERTFDWYTQDKHGNVWYFGENSTDYRHGHWVESEGSWEAGVNGAEPGIMMRPTQARRCLPAGVLPGARRGPGEGAGRHRPGEGAGRDVREHDRHPGDVTVRARRRGEEVVRAGIGEIKSQDVKGSKEGFRLVKVTLSSPTAPDNYGFRRYRRGNPSIAAPAGPGTDEGDVLMRLPTSFGGNGGDDGLPRAGR